MDIPPTQTHPMLIFVIFLALWSTVVGRTVSSLMVCMTGCHGLRGGFPLPQRMPPSLPLWWPSPLFYLLSLRTIPHSLVCLFFSFSPLQPSWKNNQPGPSCAACYTYCPAGIHCLQLVPRHVFDSMRTCIRANLLVHFCRLAHVCQGANVSTHLSINTFSVHFMISRKSGSLGKPWKDTGLSRSNY